MRVKHYLLLGFSSVILFHNCVFQPDENFVELAQAPKATITGAELERATDLATVPDTFQLYTRFPTFHYAFRTENIKQGLIDVYVDNNQTDRFQLGDSVVFGISTSLYSDGYHTLSIRSTVNTGTGSLADIAGLETVELKREWKFFVQRFETPVINITSIEARKGRLVIEFDPNPVPTERQLDFEYADDFQTAKWSVIITDPTQTQYIDDQFIGGPLEVTLTNLSVDPAVTSGVTTQEASFNSYPMIASYESDGHGKVIVKITRSPFYNNVKNYSLTVNEQTLQTQSGADTTIVVENLWFPWTHDAYVRTYAARLASSGDAIRLRPNHQNIVVGEKIDVPLTIASWSPTNPTKGFAADQTKKEVYMLDRTDLTQTFSYPNIDLFAWAFSTANDGETLYMGADTKIVRFDKDGNSSVLIDTEVDIGQARAIQRISVGSRYLAFAIAVENSMGKVYVYDLQNDVFVGDPIDTRFSFFALISIQMRSDDKYFGILETSNFTIYKFEGGVLVPTKTFPFNEVPAGFFFDAAHDNKMLLMRNDHLTIYDPDTDQSTVKNYTGPVAQGFMQSPWYDPVTGYVSSVDLDYYYITDPATGEVVRRIPSGENTRIQIYNGNLYKGTWKYDCKF